MAVDTKVATSPNCAGTIIVLLVCANLPNSFTHCSATRRLTASRPPGSLSALATTRIPSEVASAISLISCARPSASVKDALEKQMRAERERRAVVATSEGERQARINVSEGERQEAINLSEGERQRRINEAKGRASEIAILAEATSAGSKLIADAIGKPFGQEAANLRLVEQYVSRLSDLLQEAEVSLVPNEMAHMQSFFAGMDQVAQSINEPFTRGKKP